MKKSKPAGPELSLTVQYEVAAAELPRWRLRRWVQRTLQMGSAYLQAPPQQMIMTLRLVDEAEGHELNHQFRGHDHATNVLTFEYPPLPTDEVTWMNDIVLCMPVIEREAQAQNKRFIDHAAHLCVHGTLHALGFDHQNDDEAREMEALETEVLAAMGIADPYTPVQVCSTTF